MSRQAGIMGAIASWVHLGDLHITEPGEENHRDLVALVAEIAEHLANGIDFVLLPGDNADNGRAEQYALIREALASLPVPVHIISGDHDKEPGDLQPFYDVLGAKELPYGVTVSGCRCLFLDMCGPGTGGPDFRLGRPQLDWLERELASAPAENLTSVVFMHSYPADLSDAHEAAEIVRLFTQHRVALVEMGHTHYNELANDGRTVFAATRSTGQIEEGAVGYSIAAIDDGSVSWRFKELGEPFPFVLITSPADRRLLTDARESERAGAMSGVRAVVFGAHAIVGCTCRVDGGASIDMTFDDRDRCWSASLPSCDEPFRLTVRATDSNGGAGEDTIEVAATFDEALQRRADGSDADAIGAWAERGLLGTQLGPNRNGKKW